MNTTLLPNLKENYVYNRGVSVVVFNITIISMIQHDPDLNVTRGI